jgi:hypothetical protein
MVHETTRCRNDDVRLLSKRNSLGNHIQTSDNYSASQRNERSESFESLTNLCCQFTGRGEDETEQRLRLVEKSLEDRQGKGGGLSTTSFGETDDVAALEGNRD